MFHLFLGILQNPFRKLFFFVGIQDYIVRGSAAVPITFVIVIVGIISGGLGVLFGEYFLEKSPEKLTKNRILFRIIILTFGAPSTILALVFGYRVVKITTELGIYYFLFHTIYVIVVIFSFFVLKYRKGRIKISILAYVFLVIYIIGISINAHDDAVLAVDLKRENENIVYLSDGSTYSGRIIAYISNYFLVMNGNGDYYLRSSENKERIYLFNRPPRNISCEAFLSALSFSL